MFLNQKYLKPKPLQTETSFDALIFKNFLFDDNCLEHCRIADGLLFV